MAAVGGMSSAAAAAATGLPANPCCAELCKHPRTCELVLLQDQRKQVLESGGRPKLRRQRSSQQLLLQVERFHRPAGKAQAAAR